MYVVPMYFKIRYIFFSLNWVTQKPRVGLTRCWKVSWLYKRSLIECMGTSACTVASVGMKYKDLIKTETPSISMCFNDSICNYSLQSSY